MFATLLLCASMITVAQDDVNVSKGTTNTQKQQAAVPAKDSSNTAKKKESNSKENATTKDSDEQQIDGVKVAAIEANVVAYTNEQRMRHGLPPLEVDKELMETAREHAAWMTRNYTLTHTNRPLAENIAMGQPHSSEAVRSWMNSSGHRANILSPGHRRIGVAAYRAANGVIFWCQQFRS